MLWSWLIACIGGKAPVEPLADPAPEVVARSGGALPALPDDFVAPELAAWVVISNPFRGDLTLHWRPGPDADSIEVELDASSEPRTTGYTVEVSQIRCPVLGVEPCESQEWTEGPWSIRESAWTLRPPYGVGADLTSVTAIFVLHDELGTALRRTGSNVYLFRDAFGNVVAVDAHLAFLAFEPLRQTADSEYPYGGPLGLNGQSFMVMTEVQR